MSRQFTALLFIALSLSIITRCRIIATVTANAASDVVISQVYGGGGNSGAAFKNDFIELFNRSSSPVNLNGWSIQYTSASSSSWSKTELAGTIAPGHYFLIQLAGGANGAPLPTPDATASIAMAATAGKVALVNSMIALSGSCPTSSTLVDMIGYGTTASCFEGSGAAPSPSNTLAALRAGDGCTDTDNNQTDFVASTPTPRNSASPVHLCQGSSDGPRFTADDLKITLADAPCAATQVEMSITNSGTRMQRDNAGPELTVQLPAELKVATGSCQSSAGNCAVISETQLEWNGSISVNETVTITYQLQISSDVERACFNSTVKFDANDDGVNEAMVQATACATANCQGTDPGLPFPAEAGASATRAGSVLIFPFYSSNSSTPHLENTRIAITNTNVTRSVTIHFFFIADEAVDTFLCLPPNQTYSFLASDIDPDFAGYIVAIAVDESTGCPINFNFLIGDEHVKLRSGHTASLNAEAFAALAPEPVTCSPKATTAELRFDGVNYSRAPRTLAVDNLPSPSDSYATLLILNRLDGSFVTGASAIEELVGTVFNEAGASFSFTLHSSRRQFRALLSNHLPRITPNLSEIIPAGHVGWMRISHGLNEALIGAVITAHSQLKASTTSHTGGRNLYHLTLVEAATLTIPIMPPRC